MSAPLRSILNHRDVSPPRSARPRAPEPVSAISAPSPPPFGPPEPVSATYLSRASDHRSHHYGQPAPRREYHAAASTAYNEPVAGLSSRSTGAWQQAIRKQQLQPPPKILNPSQSILAKRRRRQKSLGEQQSSSPPQSPPKRRRLPESRAYESPSRAPPVVPIVEEPSAKGQRLERVGLETPPETWYEPPTRPTLRLESLLAMTYQPSERPQGQAYRRDLPSLRLDTSPATGYESPSRSAFELERLHATTYQPRRPSRFSPFETLPATTYQPPPRLPSSSQLQLPPRSPFHLETLPAIAYQPPSPRYLKPPQQAPAYGPTLSPIHLETPPATTYQPPHASSFRRQPPSPPPPPAPARPPPPPPFSGIFSSLLTHPDLLLIFSTHLTLPALVSLYSISRPYHAIVNTRLTAWMLAHAGMHAPAALLAFPFHCYRRFCIRDPGGRLNEAKLRDREEKGILKATEKEAAEPEIRFVPSLRWLAMIEWRSHVASEILALLQVEGLNLPLRTHETLLKLWFTMDVSDNQRRLGVIHNETFWTSDDLWRATAFFVKLDMRFTNPRCGRGSSDLRKLLLMQKSLSVLWKVLKREECRTQLEVLRMAVRSHYVVPNPQHAKMPILGVPPRRVGRLQWEGYGKRVGSKMLQVDELVMREGVRRELNFQTMYLDMALDGFVDKRVDVASAAEWEDSRRQDEVEVVDVVVDPQGRGMGDEDEESEWESDIEEEDEREAEQEGDEEEEDDKENEEPEDEHPGLMGMNLFFEADNGDLNGTVAQYATYMARVRAGWRTRNGGSSQG